MDLDTEMADAPTGDERHAYAQPLRRDGAAAVRRPAPAEEPSFNVDFYDDRPAATAGNRRGGDQRELFPDKLVPAALDRLDLRAELSVKGAAARKAWHEAGSNADRELFPGKLSAPSAGANTRAR